MVEMNIFQQIFALFFAILYGVMLQSLKEFQPYPLGGTRKGGKDKTHLDDTEIEMRRKRVLWSFMLLNVGPFLYFILTFKLLGSLGGTSILLLFIPIWSALEVFGFYRFYHVLAIRKRETIFKDRWPELIPRGLQPDEIAHFLWALFYLLSPLLLIGIGYSLIK